MIGRNLPDYTSKFELDKVISLCTMNERQVNMISSNMEVAGFLKGMDELIQTFGLEIEAVVTDAHTQIISVMSESN